MPQKLSSFFGKTLTSTSGINTAANIVSPSGSFGDTNALPQDSNKLFVAGNAYVSGNLGIGTTASTTKLEVDGNIRVTGFVSATDGFNIGIQSTGSVITTGLVTAFNFVGAGNTFLYNATTKTVDISISGSALSISTSTTSVAQDLAFVGGSGTSVIGIATTTNRLVYIPSSGNLGIGTTNPLGQLQVSSGPVIIGAATSTGTASQRLQVTGGAYVSGNLGIGTTNPLGTLQVGAGTSTFIVTQVGTAVSVGIGTTIPLGSLQVGAGTSIVLVTSTGSVGVGTTNPLGSLQVGAGSSIVLVTSTGSVGIGTTIPLGTLQVNSGTSAVVVSAGGSVGIGTTNPLGRLQINSGTSAVVVSAGGSVGIGTTNPLGQLQVGSGATVGSGSSVFIVSGIGSVGVGTTNPKFQMHIVGVGSTALFVVGESQLTRVAITTTSLNALTLEAGRTYIYYAPTTLTLPLSPTAGDRIEVINRSGVTTAVLARNGQSIMGLAENLDLDVINGAFTVTYSNVTDGWVIGR